MYSIKITKDANNDIEDIVMYICDELKNPIAAKAFLDELQKSYMVVAQNPEMYALCNDFRLKKAGYRKIIVKNYIIFYRIDYSLNIVYIMRVIYGRRDYTKLI